MYFVGRPMYIYTNNFPSYSWNEKCFRQHFLEKTTLLCSLSFSENGAFFEIMRKNIVDPQMT